MDYNFVYELLEKRRQAVKKVFSDLAVGKIININVSEKEKITFDVVFEKYNVEVRCVYCRDGFRTYKVKYLFNCFTEKEFEKHSEVSIDCIDSLRSHNSKELFDSIDKIKIDWNPIPTYYYRSGFCLEHHP